MLRGAATMETNNIKYNDIIDKQYKEYTKNLNVIEKKTNRLIRQCRTRFIFECNKEKFNKRIQQLGGAKNLIEIGGGGFIFRGRLDHYNKTVKIINMLIQRNNRVNFYGGLYYELANQEYICGATSLETVLNSMGIETETTSAETTKIKTDIDIDADLFNYTVQYYLNNTEI